MKRFLLLLVLLVGGVVAAALVIPTNAAVVNGTSISQQHLNDDLNAIAQSPDYQCYLNSQQYLQSNGQSALPPVSGVGTGQNEGDNPTATSAFVATYLDDEVTNSLLLQLGQQHHVTLSQSDLDQARQGYEEHITQVMQGVAQTAEGQNAKFSCGSLKPLTGAEVLATMPTSFVDEQVQVFATENVLAEDLAGVGASDADLQQYFHAHEGEFDTACFTIGVFPTQQDAELAATSVASGKSFSDVATGTAGGGPQGCDVLYGVSSQLGPDAHLDTLAVNAVSKPISYSGEYLLVQITKKTPNSFDAVKDYVTASAQSAGLSTMQKAVETAARRADVTVDPRYGQWVSVAAQVATPFTPPVGDVLNAPANSAALATSPANPFGG